MAKESQNQPQGAQQPPQLAKENRTYADCKNVKVHQLGREPIAPEPAHAGMIPSLADLQRRKNQIKRVTFESIIDKHRTDLTDLELMHVERWVRQFVRRNGGFRADLTDEQIELGTKLVAVRGKPKQPSASKTEVCWDWSIPLKGMKQEKFAPAKIRRSRPVQIIEE